MGFQQSLPRQEFASVRYGSVSTYSIMPRVLTGHDRTAGNGPRTASSDVPSKGQIDDAATSAAPTRIGRSSLFKPIVAQDLCTRTGALLVPKSYRSSERLVARLANFNQVSCPRKSEYAKQ